MLLMTNFGSAKISTEYICSPQLSEFNSSRSASASSIFIRSIRLPTIFSYSQTSRECSVEKKFSDNEEVIAAVEWKTNCTTKLPRIQLCWIIKSKFSKKKICFIFEIQLIKFGVNRKKSMYFRDWFVKLSRDPSKCMSCAIKQIPPLFN